MNRRALYGIAINLLSRYLDVERRRSFTIRARLRIRGPPMGVLFSGIAETHVLVKPPPYCHFRDFRVSNRNLIHAKPYPLLALPKPKLWLMTLP